MEQSTSFSLLFQKLIDSLQLQDRERLAHIFRQYPNHSLENSLHFLEAKQDVYDLAGLDAMATSLTHGGKLNEGRDFASACLIWGVTLWSSGIQMPEKDLEYYLGNSSYLIQKALLDAGQFQLAIAQYESMAGSNLPGWNKQAFVSTHLQAAENYLESNNSDYAQNIVDNVDESLVLPAALILYDRLKNKLKLLKTKTFQSHAEVESYKRSQKLEDLKRMLSSFKTVMKGYEDLTDMHSIEKLIELHEGKGDISDAELIELTQKISAKTLEAQAFMAGVDNAETPQSKRHQLTEQTAFFHDEKLGHDRELLQACLLDLDKHYKWFLKNSLHSDLAFVAYCQYICHNRLESYQEAADALDKVYFHLEKQRSSIQNIHERAGVFGQYPALFGVMAFTNYMSKNTLRLFHRIEASKGRNLQDRLLETTGKQEEIGDPDKLKDRLLPFLKANNAHYLTILVDLNQSYSILLTKQGRFFASAMGASEEVLEDWSKSNYACPSTWRASISGFFRPSRIDIPLELGKFINPIEYAIEEGCMEMGDHVVYSPDGILNLFSLQFAKLKSGEALIERFSVSKIHSGFQLLNLLEKEPQDLDEILAVTCTADQDIPEKIEAFEKIPRYLLPQEEGVGEEEEVSIKNVIDVLLPNKLYHFSTHGVFPKPVAQADHLQLNPYHNSGLLLMANGEKPKLDVSFNYHKGDNLLSPKVLSESKIDMTGSHVSMQACVSGRSAEGYGGDALGLEWAFFYCGAKSMVSASWDIDIHWSNRLFQKFYNNWIHKKNSIREAHRLAVIEIKKEAPDNPFPSEYYWAGLSLIGDFR